MIMISHLAPGVNYPVEAFAALGERIEPRLPIQRINEDILSPISARGDVVKGSCKF